MTNKSVPYSLLFTLATLILLNSPKPLTYAENQEPYGTVNKFCSQKTDTKDREFCMTVLKSDPRSATAKDNIALLLISEDLAIQKLSKTRDYLDSSQQSNLKECLGAYNWGIGELQIIPRELKDDPATASYDALMARDAMDKCKESLDKYKISDPYVSRSQETDMAYVKLCVDISMTIG